VILGRVAPECPKLNINEEVYWMVNVYRKNVKPFHGIIHFITNSVCIL
jgi:hypothetical protein